MLNDTELKQLLIETERYRREKKSMDTTPIPGIRDYGVSGTAIAQAVHHLDESVPSGQKRRTELAFIALRDGVAGLGQWLDKKGYDVIPFSDKVFEEAKRRAPDHVTVAVKELSQLRAAVEKLRELGYTWTNDPFGVGERDDGTAPQWFAPPWAGSIAGVCFPTCDAGQEYVLGFVFNEALTRVLLIMKERGMPHLVNKWNGLGGRVEARETPEEAMTRELKEESGLFVSPSAWRRVAPVQYARGRGGFILMATLPGADDFGLVRRTDEGEVYWLDVGDILVGGDNMPNLMWMIGLCLDPEHPQARVDYSEARGQVPRDDEGRPFFKVPAEGWGGGGWSAGNQSELHDAAEASRGYVDQDRGAGRVVELPMTPEPQRSLWTKLKEMFK